MKRRLLVSITIVFGYLVVLLFQKDVALLEDLGRHLRVGEIVLSCLCVPQTNVFSYTHPDFPIVNHEWLAQVIFYIVASAFGLESLLVLKMLLVIATVGIVYYLACKKHSVFWATVIGMFFITIFSMRFRVRPELFSYFFIASYFLVLELYQKKKNTRLLFLLPLIMLVWVNMHIFFIIGIGIFGLFVLQEFLRTRNLQKAYIIVGFLLIVATLINPSFLKGALLPFTIFSNYNLVVEENMSPFTVFQTNTQFHYVVVLQVLVFELLLMIFSIVFFLKEKQSEVIYRFSGAFAAVLAIRMVRNISLFGLLSFIPIVVRCSSLEKKLTQAGSAAVWFIRITLSGIACVVVFVTIRGLVVEKQFGLSYVPYGEKAADFIAASGLKGRIFNNYRIGNYLIYRLYPKERVFVDARPEMYPSGFFDEYWKMMEDESFFNAQVKRYGINTVVFGVDDDPVKIRPFLLRLIQSKQWIPVYADGMVSIFVKNNDSNREIIRKYQLTVE